MVDAINLMEFHNEFVIHYGGRLPEVNANTFANSLIYLSNIIEKINYEINPQFAVEIIIQALGPGSFRPKIKITRKDISSLFKGLIKKEQIIPIFIALLTLWKAQGPQNIKITKKEDKIIFAGPIKKLIMPKELYDQTIKIYGDISIQKNIINHYSILDNDPSITNFGIAQKQSDTDLVFETEKKEFPPLTELQSKEESPLSQIIEERIKIQVIRAILEKKKRKWEFVWRGIRISATIEDDTFYNKLAGGLKFGMGDSIDVTLARHQIYDQNTNVWLNESYSIQKYHGYTPAPKQRKIN